MSVLLIVVLIVLFIFCDKIADFIVTRYRNKAKKQVSSIVDPELHKYGFDNEGGENNER